MTINLSPLRDLPRPVVEVNVVIIGRDASTLGTVVIKERPDLGPGHLALPGDVLLHHEDVEQAAIRIVTEQTTLSGFDLHLIGVYSKPKRHPEARVLSVAFVCTTVCNGEPYEVGSRGVSAAWVALEDSQPLAFDHGRILQDGLDTLRRIAVEHPVAAGLIPAPFTLAEFQTAQEILLGRPVDKRNFRRDAEERGWLEETGDWRRGAHRPARLYRVKREEEE